MANRAQSRTSMVEKMHSPAKPPESSGAELLTPQRIPQQPPESSGAGELTPQQPLESSGPGQLIPQQPLESSGPGQLIPQQFPEFSEEEKLPDKELMTGLSQKLSSAPKGKREASSAFNLPELENVFSPPTSREAERLFFKEIDNLLAIPRNGQVRMANMHALVRGCSEDTSYIALFGCWTAALGYISGPIVETVKEMTPFLKRADVDAIKKARGYLFESWVVRKEELLENSSSYETRAYTVKIVEGTLRYFDKLLKLLSQEDAGPWIPLGLRSDAAL